MKKKLFVILFFFFLWVCGGFAQTSSVLGTPITADYSATPPTVTFEVSWPAGTRDATHRSKVWLLIDYRRIKDNAYAGKWLRAGIAALPTATHGTPTLEAGNTNGFWLQGTDGAFAATVTVPVTVAVGADGYAPQFGWCVVPIDRPPRAEEKSAYYALYGTAPFIIQTIRGNPGSTVSQPTAAYDKCIYGLTDATGCPGEIPDMPEITDFTASTTTICEGQSVTLTASATNAASYSFNNGDWSSSSTTVVKPNVTTTYTLSVRSAGGCTVTISTAVTVTVNDLPEPQSLTADPDVICAGESVTLTAAPAGAASYRLNSGAWQTSNTFSVNPTATTTYTLYIKSAAGCTASLPGAATVTVKDSPAGLSLTSATICNGESTILTASPEGAASYRLNSGAWQTSNTFSVNPDATTTYTLYVQSAAGCTASLPNAATVTVNAVPDAPSASSPQTFCSGSTATVANLSPTGTAIKWYNVSANGTALATAATLASGTYYASQTNDGCESTRTAVTVTVHTGVAPATISGDASNTCPATTVSLTASATGATTFTWYRNGSQVQTGTSSAYTVTSSGSYTVQGKNANCTGTTSASKVVTINGCGNVPGCEAYTIILYQTTSSIDGTGNWSTANSYCTSIGARLPSYSELQCMCANRAKLPGGYSGNYTYWSSTKYSGNYYYVMVFVPDGCGTGNVNSGGSAYFRCVL